MRKLFEILGLVSAMVMVICTAYQLGLWAIIPIIVYPIGLTLEMSNPDYREELIKVLDEFNNTLKELKENF